MDKRAKITVTGRVQRSGYRLMVDRIAFGLGLKGTVGNLPDDTVEIICEGPEALLDEFSRQLEVRKFPIRVDSVRVEKSAATGEFREFVRLPDERLDADPSWKLDLGIIALQDLSEKQDMTIVEVKAVDSHITAMDSHITGMDRNIGGHFDKLDAKYDKFGASLAQAAGDIHDMKDDIHAVKGDINGMKCDIHDMKGDMNVVKGDITDMKGDLRHVVEATRRDEAPS
jgi:acylphosphatase